MNSVDEYQEQTSRILNELVEKFDQPEEIPVLTEMFSKMLVLSAEQNLETSNTNLSTQKKIYPKFSKELSAAYKTHSKMCQNWRDAGRPGDASHPTKIYRLKSQHIMRQITREDKSRRACQLHDELMEVHFKDISRVSQKLKKIRGDKAKSSEIPLIDTLCGRFIGDNVLEGFRRNMRFFVMRIRI